MSDLTQKDLGNIIANRLEDLRYKCEKSIEEFADILSISVSSYNRYKTGEIASQKTIAMAVKKFQVSYDYIYGATDREESTIDNAMISSTLGFEDKNTPDELKFYKTTRPVETLVDKVIPWSTEDENGITLPSQRELEREGYREIERDVFSMINPDSDGTQSEYTQTIELIANNFRLVDMLARFIFHKVPFGKQTYENLLIEFEGNMNIENDLAPEITMERIKRELFALRNQRVKKSNK